MQADDCPDSVLQPVLSSVHLKELGSVKKYKDIAAQNELKVSAEIKMVNQLITPCSMVLTKVEEKEQILLENGCNHEYIDKMKTGLEHWTDGGKNDFLNWGIINFIKE
jgi:sarcosine/dimethylglycine N-methyltransferase